MFSTERSDFWSTIAGYLFAALILIATAFGMYNTQFEWSSNNDASMLLLTVIVLCIGAGIVALWKAFILDGMTFLMVAIVGASISSDTGPMATIVLILLAALIAVMSFRVGDIYVMVLNSFVGLALVILVLMENVDVLAENTAVLGTVLLLAGVLAGYLCVSDWTLVQDISLDYEEEMFGDDGCCCDGECHCGGEKENDEE